MRSKRSFSLIEVMVGLTLLALLLTTFSFFSASFLQSHKQQKAERKAALQERFLDEQLNDLFSKVASDSPFFLNHQGLVFVFDHGADLEPLLSSDVLACLYHDAAQHALCLTLWPKPSSEETAPTRTLLLCDQVDSLSFSFYNPPDPFKLTVSPDRVGAVTAPVGEVARWDKEYNLFPALVTLTINGKSFAYDLGKRPLCYPGAS